MEIIPSINAKTFEEVEKKVRMVESLVSWAHLDIADGSFTPNVTWHNPADLKLLNTNLNIEVHLMVSGVDKKIGEWLIPEIKRIFFHLNACADPDFVIDQCREAGVEPGIAIGPDEPWTKAGHYKGRVNIFQILGVAPGPAGQKTSEDTFKKIREMKKFSDSFIIEVDGGMNKETVQRAAEAGADIIVAATAIYG